MKKPRYYHNGRFTDIPECTLELMRPFIEANPCADKEDLFRYSGDILSQREFDEVVAYFTNQQPTKKKPTKCQQD